MRANMLELMTIFVRVVELGSFTKAADALELHRPAVSKAVQQLESDLGAKLLQRTTRSLSITTEGEMFFQRARQMLADADDLLASFSPTQPPRGRLRVDAPLALTHSLLVPALGEFQARYPDIEFILTAADRKTDLIAEGIDCVIRLGELEDSSFISRRLGDVRMVTCAAPSYLEKHGTPQTPDDLAHHKAVNFFSEHSREMMAWEFIRDGRKTTQRPASSMLVNNSDVLLSCALAGMGVVHALHLALAPHIQRGELVEILSDDAPVTKPVSVLYPDRQYLAPKVRVFIDWFSELFARQS